VGAVLQTRRLGETIVHLRFARTLLGRPLYWTGAYLLEGLLLDCGPPATAGRLLAALAGQALTDLVLTHHHEDHSGGAALLAARRGLTPRIHAAGIDPLARGFRLEPYRRLVWGRPKAVEARMLGAELRCGRLRFDVIHTPGHCPDHICLYEAERGWLFTGDLFLAERVRYLRADEDLGQLIRSLKRVAELPARAVYCAHRGEVLGGTVALRRKAAWLEELVERARELLQAGLSNREVTRRLLGREGPVRWLSQGHFSRHNLALAAAGCGQGEALGRVGPYGSS